MKNKFKIIFLALLCLGAVMLTACGGDDTPSLINTSTADQTTTVVPAETTPAQSTPASVDSTTVQQTSTTVETTTAVPVVTTPAETTDPANAGWSDFH